VHAVLAHDRLVGDALVEGVVSIWLTAGVISGTWGSVRRLRMLGMLLLLVVVAGGCRNGDEPASGAHSTPIPTATPRPVAYPVAYRLRRSAALQLARADAWQLVEREGRVVARSEWDDGYAAIVLSEWLDERGIRLDLPSDLRSVVERLANEQELTLLVVTGEHRRYAELLARLDPTERELRSFYERFSGQTVDDAGQAMLAWLRVFRLALANADARHVVIIPALI
jgi:hypothetical protein